MESTNGVAPSHIIDLTPLLRDLERQIEEADQEMRAHQLKAVRLRGLRDGVLLAVEHANRPTIMTSSTLDIPAGAQSP